MPRLRELTHRRGGGPCCGSTPSRHLGARLFLAERLRRHSRPRGRRRRLLRRQHCSSWCPPPPREQCWEAGPRAIPRLRGLHRTCLVMVTKIGMTRRCATRVGAGGGGGGGTPRLPLNHKSAPGPIGSDQILEAPPAAASDGARLYRTIPHVGVRSTRDLTWRGLIDRSTS